MAGHGRSLKFPFSHARSSMRPEMGDQHITAREGEQEGDGRDSKREIGVLNRIVKAPPRAAAIVRRKSRRLSKARGLPSAARPERSPLSVPMTARASARLMRRADRGFRGRRIASARQRMEDRPKLRGMSCRIRVIKLARVPSGTRLKPGSMLEKKGGTGRVQE